MELTRERALELHRRMWTDMKRDLGDCPSLNDRIVYKCKWCKEYIEGDFILNDCFLCEYVEEMFPDKDCVEVCPIKWINDDCCGAESWETMPISKLLALPEREIDEVN